MTPKTVIEKEIATLSQSLAPLTPQMQAWAEKNIFLKWGVLSRGRFHCLECSHSWKPDPKDPSCGKFTKCTACRGSLKMFGRNQPTFREIEYSAVLDTKGSYQIVRIICSHKKMKKNRLPYYWHKEVMQHWINQKGEVRSMSLSCNVFSQAYDAWKYYSELEIRPKDFQNSPKFRIVPYSIYLKLKVAGALKRNGFKGAFYNILPQILFSALLRDPIAETLLKTTQISLLSYYLKSSEQHLRENWQALKVCLKENYAINDYPIWEDYIALLRWFKKDLSCPLYVCPENLYEAHHRLVIRKRAIQQKQYLLQMRSEILQAQKIYVEEKKAFFGLCFKDRNLSISVIENVQDFMDEGDTLHHCLFANEYHKKKSSLILSAKMDSQSVETIEVSLKTLEIIQCRGMKNDSSEHHKRIMDLMSRNLNQIEARMKKKQCIT